MRSQVHFIKTSVVLIISLFFIGQATADAITNFTTQEFGFGATSSCGAWIVDSDNDIQAETWILGFWSGLNVYNMRDHVVGDETDGLGIIGEVRLECEAKPSEKLSHAVLIVYSKMR